MRSITSKPVELARINLAYAMAEIPVYGDGSQFIKRVLHHIKEADAWLASAPLNAGEPPDSNEQSLEAD
jgi:hypothetical protein